MIFTDALSYVAAVLFVIALVLFFLIKFCLPSVDSGNFVSGEKYILKKPRLPPETDAAKVKEGVRGQPHTCPVCAAKFEHGETIFSKIFPPTSRNDRLLHISGCPYCRNGQRRRECPACRSELNTKEYLIARIFKRGLKSHVHILGCCNCRRG